MCFTHGHMTHEDGIMYDPEYFNSVQNSELKNRIYFKTLEVETFSNQECLRNSGLNISLENFICWN